jgi:hypothetical protein
VTDAEYAETCRLRTKALLKIARGIYDEAERAMIERSIREFEVLAIAAGPGSPAAEAPSDPGRDTASARRADSNR